MELKTHRRDTEDAEFGVFLAKNRLCVFLCALSVSVVNPRFFILVAALPRCALRVSAVKFSFDFSRRANPVNFSGLAQRGDANSGVYNDAALAGRQGDNGIEIQLGYLRNFFHQTRNAQQYIFHGVRVGCGMATVALQ